MGGLFGMLRALYPTLGLLKTKLQFFQKKNIRLVQVTKYSDTVNFAMWNSQETILKVKPFLNQLK